jgi:hypothetical protein
LGVGSIQIRKATTPVWQPQSKRQNIGDSWLLLEFTQHLAYNSSARGSENSMSEFSVTRLKVALWRAGLTMFW